IATEIPNYYGPISSGCILKSTIDYCIGSIIECEYPDGISIPPSSSRFPQYLRRKTGTSESFVHFMFPDIIFPEKQFMGTYLPAIPDIIEIVDRVNDVMSFYKECVVGTEENNFIITSAKLRGCDPITILDKICQDLVKLSKDVKATLDRAPGGNTELKEAFSVYVEGFIMWHITGKRYRLDEIG
ncbi:Trichodiene synthase, partial [Trichophaea hybrida]